MKKILSLLLIVIFIVVTPEKVESVELETSAKSAILIEASTGQVIYEKNADEILRPASITKIMTLILIYDAIANGQINLSDEVMISEHAASMGGSQVYLETGETQTVETLIKCIAIASANDACVAMAECIAGSEEAFVEKMNERAKGLSMSNTHFVNCCGLDIEGHVTTARDISLMSRELITKYPQIHDISTIWMDTITHITRKGEKPFTLTNTNKLLKQYEWATGLKTGSTSLAGFCLSATAKKNNIELISVVMASENSKTRVSDSVKILNYGYSVCRMYMDENMPPIPELKIKGALNTSIKCEFKNSFSHLFLEELDTEKITSTFEFLDDIKAPIKKGETVGQLVYFYNGKAIGSVDIISAEDVKKAGYCDYLSQIARHVFFL